MSPLLRVTVVCTGNICRSPIGEAVLRDAVQRAGLRDAVHVDSAGIGAWHVGGGADRRAEIVLAAHGYDASDHVVAQITPAWFQDGRRPHGRDPGALPAPGLLLAMDTSHYDALRRLAPGVEVWMYRSFDPVLFGLGRDEVDLDVPDPYHGDLAEFEDVLEMIEAATPGVVAHLRSQL